MSSPDGKLTLVASDDAGLRCRVALDGKPTSDAATFPKVIRK